MEEPKSSATTATDSSLSAQTDEAGEAHKRSALMLVGFCHTLNHLQYSINTVLLPRTV